MGKPSSSTVASSETPLGDRNLAAGSLLARGSAADLRIIQNNALSRHDREPLQSNQSNQYDDCRTSKRKRSCTAAEFVLRHPHNVNDSDPMQQQLSSRDIMPPPPRRLQDANSTISIRPASSRLHQYVDQSPSRSGHYGRTDDYNFITRPATYTRAGMLSEDLSNDAFEGTAQVPASFLGERHIDDSKVDQNFGFPSLGSRQPGVSPNRLTLPSSTPSMVSRATPHRVGMLANARTSKSALPRPESSRSPHRMANYRVPSNGQGPSASPYFGSRRLPANQAVASPFINRPSLSAGRQSTPNHSAANPPILAPTASTPWKQLSWFTAPFRQGQHQGQTQQRSITEELQSGSGAYRQPCARQHVTDQRPSHNSFSFTNQPQIESLDRGYGSRNIFAKHGRRAARR